MIKLGCFRKGRGSKCTDTRAVKGSGDLVRKGRSDMSTLNLTDEEKTILAEIMDANEEEVKRMLERCKAMGTINDAELVAIKSLESYVSSLSNIRSKLDLRAFQPEVHTLSGETTEGE